MKQNFNSMPVFKGRRFGPMVSELDSRASGFEPWLGILCYVLGLDTKWVLANLMPGVILRRTSITFRDKKYS